MSGRRAASPAASLSGFDILGQLLGAGSDSEDGPGVASFGGAAKGGKQKANDVAAGSTANTVHTAHDAFDLSGAPENIGDDGDSDAEFIAATQAASNRKAGNVKGRSVKKGGGFQAMGLNGALLKAITRKGFSVPTPIQRKTIPLLLDGRDVVGMARTGSGKTAAFVIPMIEKLKTHSAKVGARALIMSPSRELALQTLKVVKELGRGTDLKCVLLVGGDSLEEQFGMMASNPDIVIATPGRFLHLKVEMNLDLSSIKYVVFDEADRLFEMGFAAQLTEILHGLPPSRQTLLFSATLPKSLVEFARAGLQEPSLVRLDTEGKISPDLQSAFFTVKSGDKEGSLLYILHDLIQVPTGETPAAIHWREGQDKESSGKKRKRGDVEGGGRRGPTEHSTIVFTATKHHVEYIANLLRAAGFATSHLYGSLDQTARNMQVQDFRTGMTNILVVTDVAARGVDIPILANVINYDFPPQPKIYVHRVGRTARAGQRGWSYSLVRDSDCPYMLDLQLFLGRRLVLGRAESSPDFAQDVVVGSLPRDKLEQRCEWVNKTLDEDFDVSSLRTVAAKGEKLFMRTRNSASSESAKRSKSVTTSEGWVEMHALFQDETDLAEIEREKMLAVVSGFRPAETIFEIGKKKGQEEAGEVVKKRREAIEKRKLKQALQRAADGGSRERADDGDSDAMSASTDELNHEPDDDDEGLGEVDADVDMDSASDSELEVTFSDPSANGSKKKRGIPSSADAGGVGGSYQDSEHFMSYMPSSTNVHEERGYGVHSGGSSNNNGGGSGNSNNFLLGAREAAMDLGMDEGADGNFGIGGGTRGKRWDKRHKKYVSRNNDFDGSREDGKGKLVRGESGVRIAASFRSGRFDDWRKRNRLDRLPRVGEMESNRPMRFKAYANGSGGGGGGGDHDDGEPASMGGGSRVAGLDGKRFKHTQNKAPKPADKFRDDYYKKKKRLDAARDKAGGISAATGGAGAGAGRSANGAGGVRSSGSHGGRGGRRGTEVKSVQAIRKERMVKEKRREKTGRPSRRK